MSKPCVVPDGLAPPRPPSRTWPYRAWSAYSRADWAKEGSSAVTITRGIGRRRLVDKEIQEQLPEAVR